MQCSLCNGKTRVLHTRKNTDAAGVLQIPKRYHNLVKGNYIYRKHECECGNVFESVEVDVDDLLKVQKVVRQDIISKVTDLMVRL